MPPRWGFWVTEETIDSIDISPYGVRKALKLMSMGIANTELKKKTKVLVLVIE